MGTRDGRAPLARPGQPGIPDPAATETEAALLAQGVTKRYGATVALDSVSLAIPRGSITALVGPNGAGKSTLLRAWMGFEAPTIGRVLTDGRDPIGQRAASLAKVAYLAQSPSLYAELSAREHLDLADHFRRGSFDRAAAAGRLARVGIDINEEARRLSGGGQAQLGLALAIGLRARVLLLDEPLAHLDPLARREFLEAIADYSRAGVTVVISSHIISDLERACDRLVLLAGGRIRVDAWIDDLVPGLPMGSIRAAALEDLVIGRLTAVRDGLP